MDQERLASALKILMDFAEYVLAESFEEQTVRAGEKALAQAKELLDA